MPNLNHISVEIDAAFGSQFQEESALRMLHIYIQTWKEFYLEKHSRNAFDFRITSAALVKRPPRTTRD